MEQTSRPSSPISPMPQLRTSPCFGWGGRKLCLRWWCVVGLRWGDLCAYPSVMEENDVLIIDYFHRLAQDGSARRFEVKQRRPQLHTTSRKSWRKRTEQDRRGVSAQKVLLRLPACGCERGKLAHQATGIFVRCLFVRSLLKEALVGFPGTAVSGKQTCSHSLS